MKFIVNSVVRAISYLAVGIAFFLWGCYPQPILELPREFDLAEQDVQAGDYDRAIQRYELYLKEQTAGEGSRLALYAIARPSPVAIGGLVVSRYILPQPPVARITIFAQSAISAPSRYMIAPQQAPPCPPC